jgi:hypothetical protein
MTELDADMQPYFPQNPSIKAKVAVRETGKV